MNNKRRSEALRTYWEQHVDAWRRSSQSQRAFCRAHDLDYYRFGYWRKKLGSTAPDQPSGRSLGAFVAVVPEVCGTDDALSLRLPNGAVVQGIRSDNVATVCQLLARLS